MQIPIQSISQRLLTQPRAVILSRNIIFYHPWKWFQTIIGQITVVIFHEMATVSRFQTKSQTVWFLSWKSATKIKFSTPWNHCITSKKIKRGENEATHAFITNFPPKRLREGSLQSAGNSGVRAFTHGFWKISGLVWSRHRYFGSTHGLTKIQTMARSNSVWYFPESSKNLHDYL